MTEHHLVNQSYKEAGFGDERAFKHNLRLLLGAGFVEMFSEGTNMVQLTDMGHLRLSGPLEKICFYLFEKWMALAALLVSIFALMVSVYGALIQSCV